MRAQGALEYLIIIAAVLGISAVVVLFVSSAFIGSSGGADISKCRLAAANCQKDLALGITTSCDYCIKACTDSGGRDILDGVQGGGLACDQCKKGLPISAGAGTSIGSGGYWGMDEGRSITVSDGSGNGNTGTYVGEAFNGGVLTNGPTWASGTQGNAVIVDGLNDYIAVTSVPSLKYTGGDMTIMAWIKANSTEVLGDIFSKPWNGNGQYNYRVTFENNGQITFRLMGGSDSLNPWRYNSIITTSAITKSEWHHVAVTANSVGAMKIYIDGQENVSGTWSEPSWVPFFGDLNTNLAIGTLYPYGSGWGGNTDHAFNGTIDSARFWTKVLSQTDIQAEMASSRPVIRPLADWEFEENNGLFANDTHIWVAGRKGTALSFDGVDDYLTIPNSPSLNSNKEVTVAAWVNANTWAGTSSPPEDWKKVAGKGQWGSAYHLWSNGGRHVIMTIGGIHYQDGSVLPLGSWAHMAGVYNGTHIMFYYNGALTLTTLIPSLLTTNTQPFVIGKDGTTNYYHFNGSIDEVKVFNRTLSPGEIAQLYSNP